MKLFQVSLMEHSHTIDVEDSDNWSDEVYLVVAEDMDTAIATAKADRIGHSSDWEWFGENDDYDEPETRYDQIIDVECLECKIVHSYIDYIAQDTIDAYLYGQADDDEEDDDYEDNDDDEEEDDEEYDEFGRRGPR